MRAVIALFALASIGGPSVADEGPGVTAVQLALELEQAGDDGRARAALEHAMLRRPSWELPRLELARLCLKTGADLDAAELHLETARALAPENPRVHYLWAQLMQERGRLDEALQSYETALSFRPEFGDARFRAAGLYFGKQDWARAEAHYRVLTGAQPGSALPGLRLATALEMQGKLDEAESELKRLRAEQPRSPLVVRGLADFYARTHRTELAKGLLAPEKPKKMRPLKRSKR